MKIIGPMAGIGVRLRPFTYSKPKGFLKIAGKRVIDHILDLLIQTDKKKSELLLILGYQTRAIKKYTSGKYGEIFKISYENQEPKGYVGDLPFFGGLGEAVSISEKWYSEKIKSYESDDPEDYAVIFLSDMIPIDGYSGIFNRLRNFEIENPQKNNLADDFKDDSELLKSNKLKLPTVSNDDIDGVIGVIKVPSERTSSYGIVKIDEKTGLIKKLVEKPKKFISNYAIAGVYAFKPKAMKSLYHNLEIEVKKHKNENSEAELTPAIQALVKKGFKIAAHVFGGNEKVLDFGNPETLLEGNKFLLKNFEDEFGGPIKNISNSSLCSPSFIGENVEITDCIIGPFVSIGNSCVLKECILKNCVIGESCILEKIITENSIIGDYVVMDNLIKKNLIIGDRSNIRSSK